MAATMRAIRMSVSPPRSSPTLSIENVPIPEPATGQILVKVKATNIAPSDIINSKAGFPSTTFPRTPGRDFAGTVVAGTPSLIGHDVFGTSGLTHSFTQDGAHAEYVLVPDAGVVSKPAYMSFAQAAAIGVAWTTARLAFNRSLAHPGETVLVLGGTGAVGSAAVQIAKALGCKVLVGARGAKGDVDTQDQNLTSARTLTDGKGPSVIIDTVGDAKLFRAGLSVLAHGGRYAFISSSSIADGELSVNIKNIYRNEQCLIGCNSVDHSQVELAQSLGVLMKLVENGTLVPPSDGSFEKINLDTALDVYAGKKKGKFMIIL